MSASFDIAASTGTYKVSIESGVFHRYLTEKLEKLYEINDNLYVLKGGGGNTAVFVMANGVTLVDTKLPVYTSAVIYVLVFLSLRLLVRTSNQVSLAHAGFAEGLLKLLEVGEAAGGQRIAAIHEGVDEDVG